MLTFPPLPLVIMTGSVLGTRIRRAPAPPMLEWQIHEDADDPTWHALTSHPTLVTPTQAHRRRWLLWSLGAALLLALLGGVWALRTGEHGLAQLDRDLACAVEADQWTAAPVRPAAQSAAVSAAPMPRVATDIVDLSADWAVVRVVITQGAQTYHQTQLYAVTATGWQRTAPTAAAWGEARTYTSAHFRFAYHALDEAAVLDAAAKLDGLYPALVAGFAPAPLPHRIEVVVDPSVLPGHISGWKDEVSPFTPLVTASPAAYLTPAGMAPGDLLAQAVLLELLNQLTGAWLRTAFMDGAALPPADAWVSWLPLLDGARLWQVWANDLPLATWRRPVVQWLLRPGADAPPPPAVLRDLCAYHRLWLAAPAALGLPVLCDAAAATLYDALPQPTPLPPKLAAFQPTLIYIMPDGTRLMLNAQGQPSSPLTTVALATVMEYAAATYGPSAIPALLSAAPQHTTWATLLPAVFGVEAATFEAGWHAYLAAEYGVPPLPGELR